MGRKRCILFPKEIPDISLRQNPFISLKLPHAKIMNHKKKWEIVQKKDVIDNGRTN